MQKKLIAMAVAGLVAAPAFAQVTISGRLDVGVALNSNDKDSKVQVQSGQYTGSRVTFKADEDLGGGMKGLIAVEAGFNADNGTGAGGSTAAAAPSTAALDNANGGLMFNRQSQVGLAGSFGQVMLGRHWTPTHLWGYATALMPQGATNWETGYKLSAYTTALSNSIEYTSPKLGPVEIRAQYGFAENSRTDVDAAGAKAKKGSLALGARATFGPANLFLGVNTINSANDATAGAGIDADKSEELAFGGNVNLGMVTPFFHFQKTTFTDDKLNATASTETETTTFSVGAKVKVGASGAVAAQFASRAVSTNGVDGAEATGLSVSYEQNLSKRTRVYAAYGMIDNDKGGMSTFGYANTKADESNSTATVGMIHFF